MRTLITNGTVISSDGCVAADVLISGDLVEAVLLPTSELAESLRRSTDVKLIDATDRYVLPGGVDVHTHMELPFGDIFASDNFQTGTRAAAWGGTTTIIDFATQYVGDDVRASLELWLAKAEGQCAIDYGFHMILADVHERSLKEMDNLLAEGVSSFKLFMAYPGLLYSDDGQILRAMQQARENGALIMMHAENGIAIDVIAEQAASRGQTAPIYHGVTRPPRLEGEAANRAIELAVVAGSPLYIVHLSSSDALEHVAAARNEGLNVFAETCPQYLYLNLEDHLGAPGFAGAGFVCSPPLRSKHDSHHADLWKGLRTNDLSVVSTDHCPFCLAEQKELGSDDFRLIPNGLGMIEHRMDLIHQGVVQGKLSLERWVEVCSTTPARMFGLYPQKGVIAPGSDADVVIYNPSATTLVSAATHHMNLDYSCLEGWELPGAVETVLARGKVIIADGAFHGRPGDGRYLKRSLSQYLL